jgi:hypothetical protein
VKPSRARPTISKRRSFQKIVPSRRSQSKMPSLEPSTTRL